MQYRCYLLAPDGHIFSFLKLEGSNDDEVTELAKQMGSGFDIELWRDSRKVAALKATVPEGSA